MKIAISIIFFILLGGIFITSSSVAIKCYNNIVQSKEAAIKSVHDLDAQYKRRYALIDNLVSIVKETKSFEKELVLIEQQIYLKTAEAKASATKLDVFDQKSVKEYSQKNKDLGDVIMSALNKLIVLAQKYPEIKDPNIKDRTETFESLKTLRRDIMDLENDILYSRQSMNEYIRVYNQNIVIFPANLVADRIGANKMGYFEINDSAEREDVHVSF